jgi:hypothetical protein
MGKDDYCGGVDLSSRSHITTRLPRFHCCGLLYVLLRSPLQSQKRETTAPLYWPLALMERCPTTLALSSTRFSALVGKTATPEVSPSSNTLSR